MKISDIETLNAELAISDRTIDRLRAELADVRDQAARLIRDLDAVSRERERLRAELAQTNEANKFLLKSCSDMEAEWDALRELLRKAKIECVEYMASGMTHAGWKTDRAKELLNRIDAALKEKP